jgi:mono/diheme cytochrome c family protein
MREGVDRRGRHLYPAFPYDHYTRMTDEDIAAVYAFLMTRATVSAEPPANDVAFPANIRMSVAGWKLLFLKPGVYEPDSSKDAAWNRGAYLVQGPGHCGACHTPRNFLGAEKRREFLAGGLSEGWNAPPLNPASATPEPWTAQALEQYLRHGITERHAIVAGPMVPVVRNLAAIPEEEIKAIAAYLVTYTTPTQAAQRERQDLPDRAALDAVSPVIPPPPGAGERDETWNTGRAIYVDTCGICHDSGRDTPSSASALHLALATALHLPHPRNLIKIIREGITPPEGEPGRWMPGYAGALTDEQMTALVRYLRADFAKASAWRNVPDEVKNAGRTDGDLRAAANTR